MAGKNNDTVYAHVTFGNDEEDEGEAGIVREMVEDGEQHVVDDEEDSTDNIWSKMNNTLRDVLVYLVKMHRIDEVMDSKVKAHQWEKLIEDFTALTDGKVSVSKPQIVRKWHNWKQYNKARKKPHPFVVVGDIDEEAVRAKCSRLVERADADPDFANLLAKGSSFEVRMPKYEDERNIARPATARLNKLQRRDFLVRRTGASASALSLKRLEHEITLESLTYEQERWKIKSENNRLVQEKLRKKLQLSDVRLEKARLELALKRSECITMGIEI